MTRRINPVAVLAAGLAVAALAGCGSSQTASPSTSRAAPQSQATLSPPCAGSQLAVSYAGTEGATGHLELTLALRNVTGRACSVRGYPAARLLARNGHALPLHLRRGHGFFPDTLPAPRAVSLAPGASAHFGISFATNNEYAGARTCRTAAAAMSAPPARDTHWQRVSLRSVPRISPCGDRFVVSPVHA